MEYTVNELAVLSGVTARTLHHYDQIGLLCPVRRENGYRVYGEKEVDLLQQILFYRELGVPLKKIKELVNAAEFDAMKALEEQLEALRQKRSQLDKLIENVQKTICAWKGEAVMSDEEKFEGLKRQMIEENERKYGGEIRTKYGEEMVEQANAKFQCMSRNNWDRTKELEEQIRTLLKQAFEEGNPDSETAQKACELHRQWLCMLWPEGTYSKEAHLALANGYVEDERFTAYYDSLGKGCTAFFRDAIAIFAGEN